MASLQLDKHTTSTKSWLNNDKDSPLAVMMSQKGGRFCGSLMSPFLWRACKNGLPTLKNLSLRGIVEKPLCPICLREDESTFHMAWSCPAVQDLWGQCSRFLQKRSFPPMSFKELWFLLCNSADMEILEEFAMVSRLIWLRRNNYIFKKEFCHTNHVIKQPQGPCQDQRLSGH